MALLAGIFLIMYMITTLALYIWGFALILKILNVMPIATYTWGELILIGIAIFASAVFSGVLFKILK